MEAKTPHHNPVHATLQHLWKLEITQGPQYIRTDAESWPLEISRICATRLDSPCKPFFPNDSQIAVKFTDTPEGRCTITPGSLRPPAGNC